ncbi:MAG: FAD-dependent oxidoreductase [Burkholderiales bacterium]|nr:FAD-dependent oxidoreductase [Burkholderiales bacterium]
MKYDEHTDIVVAGYGFAGGAAAIAAADAGKKVLLLEKMAVPGGISICSGGGLRVASNPEKAFAYLEATNAGSIPDELLRAFAQEMTKLPGYFTKLAEINRAEVVTLDRPANYPLPGYDTFQFLEISSIPDFDPRKEYPQARSLRAGINAFKVVDDNVRMRGIDVRLSVKVLRLLRAPAGEVCGVEVDTPEGIRRIGTRHGVILACGGFESDPDMQRQFWQFYPVLPAATRGNTGDGIRMAQALGADLWHMWHFHGSYGFRHTDPKYVFGIRTKKLPDWTPGVLPTSVRMSWILVDRTGRRFMNEYQPYAHDTGHRFFDRYDPTAMRFPAMPAFLVLDEAARKMYPVAKSFINDPEIEPYDWSKDNLREVELGILKRAESVADLARQMKTPELVLKETIERWNGLCASNAEDEFGRPAATRTPLSSPPFYFGEVWPVVSNTQGGLVHDVKQRVLNPYGEPIPRLYVAGELGSIWGFLYLSGGNLAECFISGRIAGMNVSAEEALML